MIAINCDYKEDVQAAKEALDTTCFGAIIMQSSEDWLIIREALFYASFFEDNKFADEINEIWKKIL